jgi:16S rRNA (uracil1498-N3)-methyltransferase
VHRIWIQTEGPPNPGQRLRVEGPEAHHAARVKRLEVGEPVGLLDGQGLTASARITGIEKLPGQRGWAVDVEVVTAAMQPPVRPRVTVRSAVPKGPRLEAMIEGLSQAGAAAWGPLLAVRSVVDPREGKLERLHRTCEESAKQSGRAWTLRIEPPASMSQVCAGGTGVLAADAAGEPYRPTGLESLTLLIGPEGGWDPAERSLLQECGVRLVSLGPHVMRIETAAVVGAGIVLHAEHHGGSGS